MILNWIGSFEESIETHERIYAGRMKVLGPNDISTITTIHDIGLVYGRKGEFDKSLEWIERSVEGSDKLRGPGHPDSLLFRSNKAVLLQRKGRLHEALVTYSQVLIGEENSLGKDHPRTQGTAASVRRIRAKVEANFTIGSATLNQGQTVTDLDTP
jgi:tetratricopeptide (TPR) repeat protein